MHPKDFRIFARNPFETLHAIVHAWKTKAQDGK